MPPRSVHDHAEPVDGDDHDRGPDAARRQVRGDHVGERGRHERQERRVVEERHRVLVPGGREAHAGRDALGHPAVDPARPAGGELGRDERRRDQEDDRRQHVEEDGGEAVDGHRRRGPQAGDRRHRHQRKRRPGDVRRARRQWRGRARRRRSAACGGVSRRHYRCPPDTKASPARVGSAPRRATIISSEHRCLPEFRATIGGFRLDEKRTTWTAPWVSLGPLR